jgi:phosphatidylglycerophosphate synthase
VDKFNKTTINYIYPFLVPPPRRKKERATIGLYKMRAGKDNVLFRLASIAHTHGATPNIITALGLSFGVATGVLFMYRQIPLAFAFGFLSVSCDVLDGTIARKFHMETTFGRLFDSLSDRFCELAVVLGALAGGIIEPLGVIAIVGSTVLFSLRVISHTRGLKTDYVMFGRTERLVFILLGLIVPFAPVSTVCFVVAGGFGFASSFQIIVFLSRRHFQTK